MGSLKLEMKLGMDVSAYVETEVHITEAELCELEANPVHYFEAKLTRDDYIFKPDWETENGFRVVGASIGTTIIAEEVWLHRPPVYEVGLMAMGIVREHGAAIAQSNLPQEVIERLLNLVC